MAALQGERNGRWGPPGVKDYPFLFLARCAAALTWLPYTTMLDHRRPWTFVRSRNSNEQADTSHGRISRKSTGTDQVSCCLRDGVQQIFGVVPPTDSPQPQRLPPLGRLDHGVAGVRREQLVQRPK